jgi:hypothetical protein
MTRQISFGSDHRLGYGNLFQDGATHDTEYPGASDQLYVDTITRTLYAVAVRMEDGRPRLVSAEALVEVHHDPQVWVRPPIDTHDIFFG